MQPALKSALIHIHPFHLCPVVQPIPTPLMKTRITKKIRNISLHCPPPFGIKQGQASEFLQHLHGHVFQLVMGFFFSCTPSNFCRGSQLALPPCCPPATASISGKLPAASPSVTLALCPPRYEPVVYSIQWRHPGRWGFAGSMALCLRIPSLLLEAPPDHTC